MICDLYINAKSYDAILPRVKLNVQIQQKRSAIIER